MRFSQIAPLIHGLESQALRAVSQKTPVHPCLQPHLTPPDLHVPPFLHGLLAHNVLKLVVHRLELSEPSVLVELEPQDWQNCFSVLD